MKKVLIAALLAGSAAAQGDRRVQVGTLDMNIALGSLPTFFLLLFLHGQEDLDIHNLIKMPHDAIHLARHITAQRRGNLNVMAADRQIHI